MKNPPSGAIAGLKSGDSDFFQRRSETPMKLYLIRHGESVYNAEGRIQGHSDVPLSELGRRQGVAVAEVLANRAIDALYCSPLQRAYEMAEIIARRLKLPIRLDDRLKEINVGVFQGRLRTELDRLNPAEIACWTSEDLDYVVPGGESRRQLVARGRAALRSIMEAGHRHAGVVSLGRVLMITLKDLVGLPLETPPYALQNGSITTLSYNEGKFELVALDQVEHLCDVGFSGSGDL
jgi:2,3-bisphosphoglycerate-dependent phosphoglycerate mutase